MKKFVKSVAALTLALVILHAGDVLAKQGNGKGHGKSEVHWQDSDKPKSKYGDRDILRGYVIGEYKRHCPPGLAKKNPPCVPPGQAKKYSVGSVLPRNGFEWVPDDIVSQLTAPPARMRYARIDKNVYLIAEGTRKVVEAIELFSAVN